MGKTSPELVSAPFGTIEGRFVQEASRRFIKRPFDHTEIFVKVAWSVALKNVLAACLTGSVRASRRVASDLRIGLGPGVDSRWGGGDVMAQALTSVLLQDDNSGDNPGPRPLVDIVLQSHESVECVDEQASVIKVFSGNHESWNSIAMDNSGPSDQRIAGLSVRDRDFAIAPVDTEVINPIGFDSFALTQRASIQFVSHECSVILDADDSKELARITNGRLDENATSALRGVCYIEDYAGSHNGPRSRATFLIEAAAAGLPVLAHDLDPLTSAYLPSELASVYNAASGKLFGDRLARETFVATAHRIAYRAHSSRNGLTAALRSALGTQVRQSAPEISVLVPSKRPEFLNNTLAQIRRQSWNRVQPVFGLHGYTLSDLSVEIRQALKDIDAQIFEASADTLFGDMMNRMTELASGDLVAKMDDDDWYSEFHLEDLVHALEYSRATMVGSGVQFVYLTHADVTVRRSRRQAYRYGGHPGGPTLMLSRHDLEAVGNWSRVNRAIDTALNDAVVRTGGTIYQGNPLNFLFNRRSSGHTWNATNEYFLKGSIDQWAGLVPPSGFSSETTQSLIAEWGSSGSALSEIYTDPMGKNGLTAQRHIGAKVSGWPSGARSLTRSI